MLKLLSPEESFNRTKDAFAALEKHMVLDLCLHGKRRFPCIVYEVDLPGRKFSVYPLTREVCSLLCEDGLLAVCSPPIEVAIPLVPGGHPTWNVIEEQVWP